FKTGDIVNAFQIARQRQMEGSAYVVDMNEMPLLLPCRHHFDFVIEHRLVNEIRHDMCSFGGFLERAVDVPYTNTDALQQMRPNFTKPFGHAVYRVVLFGKLARDEQEGNTCLLELGHHIQQQFQIPIQLTKLAVLAVKVFSAS